MKDPVAGIWNVRDVIWSPDEAPGRRSLRMPRFTLEALSALVYSRPRTPRPWIAGASTSLRDTQPIPQTLSGNPGQRSTRPSSNNCGEDPIISRERPRDVCAVGTEAHIGKEVHRDRTELPDRQG